MMIRLRPAAALLLLAVAGSCSDSTLPDNEGLMRFEYSGDRSGSFTGRGRQARAYLSTITTTIMADQFTDGGRTRMAIQIGGQSEGSYAFRPGIDTDMVGTLSFGPADAPPIEGFEIYAGTVAVTEITRKRVRGRFEASARKGLESIVTATGGYFDVPIGPEFPDLPGS